MPEEAQRGVYQGHTSAQHSRRGTQVVWSLEPDHSSYLLLLVPRQCFGDGLHWAGCMIDRWKEKGARLGAALPPGRILGLAFQLVPGVSFSSQRIKHILLNSVCA